MSDVWFGSDLTHRDVETLLRALSLPGHSVPPVLAFGDGDAGLVMASRSFFPFFGVADGEELAARLLTGRDPGARRLASLCQNQVVNGAPRLERLRFDIGPASEIVTFLCRRVLAEDRTALFVAAALGLPSAAFSSNQRPTASHVDRSAAAFASGEQPRPAEQVIRAAETPTVVALPPEAMTFQAIQATLRTRWPANRSIRFLWQTDADMVCTQLSPPLADVVGEANAALVGRNLLNVASRLDQTGRLGAALAGRTTWSGIAVPWPIGDAPAAVEVALGAIPTLDREKGFEGFRGYGVIRLDRILAHPVTRLTDASLAAVSAPGNVVTFPGSKGLSDEEQATFHALGAELRDQVGEEPQVAPAIAADPRVAKAASAGAGLQEIVSTSTAAPHVVTTTPSSPQDGDQGRNLPVPPDRPTVGRTEDVARNSLAILDRLAVGLLVSRNDVPIFANRHLLDLTDFADEDALHAAGGMAHLFGDMPGNVSGAETVGLRGRRGDIIPVLARMQRIDWDGLPATLLTLSRTADPEVVQAGGPTDPAVDSGETRSASGMEKMPVSGAGADASEIGELRAILDTATDGVVVVDAECNVLSLNRSGEALFGCERSEVVGKPFLELFAPHNQSLAADYINGLKSNPTKSLLNDGREILVKARHGETIPVFMTLGRLGNLSSADGFSAPRLCALFRDLTPWKTVEQELDSARRDAERASALKTDFLAKVSHEIRTPLNAIIGFAEAMAEQQFGPIGNERYVDYARNIQTSGNHVASLVDDLLDLSKIEAGKMDLNLDAIDVNGVVRESVALMQPQANRERVIMRLSLAPNLPRIKADQRSLRQIVLNILSNSVKFNDPGGQVIVATAATEAGCVVIRVRDTGRGMSDSDIAAAMEPFRQLATVRETTDGTGLGLPLTKALVEANEATFSIRSKVDQGTLVEVSFPPASVLAGQGASQTKAEGNT